MDAGSIALLGWLAAASSADLVATLLDKRRARRGVHRIPERTLLLVALAGGSVGLVLGTWIARHKVRKFGFLSRLAAVVVVQAFAVGALVRS